MVFVYNKLCVLVWKCVLLRQRNWLLTLLEIAAPIAIYYFMYMGLNKQLHIVPYTKENVQVTYESTRDIYEPQQVSTETAYSPKTDDTYALARSYSTYDGKEPILKDNTEALESWLYSRSMVKTSNEKCIGILFSEVGSQSTYTIRSTNPEMVTIAPNTEASISSDPYIDSGFLKTQMLFDLALMELRSFKLEKGKAFIGVFPNIVVIDMIFAFRVFLAGLTLGYAFLLMAIVRDVLQEKLSGIKELMKIMGVPSWMIWVQWAIYTLIVHVPITLIATYLLTCYRRPVISANVTVVWLLLFLFTINCMFLSFILTCLFKGPTSATLLSVIAWFSVHIASIVYIDPNDYCFACQILFCLLPLNNLIWSLWTITSFQGIGVTWTLQHLFTVGSSGSYISVGLSIVISILVMILLILILIFLDALFPGPYGVGKPITFVCQWFKNLIWFLKDSDYVRSSLPKSYEPPPNGSKVGIEIRDLKKDYGILKKVVAVQKVDLDIYEGEIMALLGHNGAGKTTTMSMITGMISPNKGVIRFNGEDIRKDSKYRDSLGICTQHNLYFPKFTVMEHLIFFGMLKGMSYKEANMAGIELLNKLNISNKSNAFGADLSGGMKRRLCLAVSLVGEPKYLILDEPTSGLDPQSRRQLWNIILDMRGQRTILITTHFMEEADVLSDRIAIMDHGFIVCCGTTMFLKRIYGTGYNFHVLKVANASSDNILNKIQQYVANPQMKQASPTQIDFILQDGSVKQFPGLFAALEDNKDSLGITGISVTCTTMEDVFLKVAEKNIKDETANNMPIPSSTVLSTGNNWDRVKGFDLVCVRYKILLWKIWCYEFRNAIFTLGKAVLTGIMIWYIVTNTVQEKILRPLQPPLEITLSIFKNYISVIQHDDESKSLADIATNILEKHRWEIKDLSYSSNFTTYLTDLYIYDYASFSKTLLYLRFIKGTITVYYKERSHLSAVAVNLLTNTLYRNFDSSSSIKVFNHPYVPQTEYCVNDFNSHSALMAIFWMSGFFFSLLLMMIEPMKLLIEERVSGFKHQQTLAGVSPVLYWMANFTYYYCLHLCVIFVYIIIIRVVGGNVVIDYGFLTPLVLSLLVYGISGTFFVYPFTFFIDNMAIGVPLFLVGNISFGLIPALLFVSQLYTKLHILFCLNPLYCISISIFRIAYGISNAYFCKNCDIKFACRMAKFPLLVMEGDNTRNAHGILLYIWFLGLTWLLYFGIILIFDSEIIRWVSLRIFYRQAQYRQTLEEDEDVRRENDLLKMLNEKKDQDTPLRVDGISKKYLCGPRAVSKVGFIVISGECFGLLGVNGAGKSTTFKILTGETFPNSGNAIILAQSVISSRRIYQSFIGYCPQFDAFINSFTGEEIITIIGRLRGIPKKDLKGEVVGWINVMGIAEHMKKQSGTYSGGTKRKLSTAMAFIGNPVVVFLDEPTSGVDPESRRKLWTVMEGRQKAGQAIVLTSHSMEECEALCTRLTIMKDGQMMCIGSPEYLKNKFSQGYNVLIKLVNPTDEKTSELKKAFEESFPRMAILDEHSTLINYQIMDPKVSLSRLFTVMLQMKSKYDTIEDFAVSNTSMEQVFLSFAKEKKDS